LRKYVKTILLKWDKKELIKLDKDLSIEIVRKYWPDQFKNKSPYRNIKLENITHYELFYTYRNSLVHELQPLSWLDRIIDEEPFYMYMIDLDNEMKPIEKNWVLNYPTIFIRNIISNVIIGLKDYLLKKKVILLAQLNQDIIG